LSQLFFMLLAVLPTPRSEAGRVLSIEASLCSRLLYLDAGRWTFTILVA